MPQVPGPAHHTHTQVLHTSGPITERRTSEATGQARNFVRLNVRAESTQRVMPNTAEYAETSSPAAGSAQQALRALCFQPGPRLGELHPVAHSATAQQVTRNKLPASVSVILLLLLLLVNLLSSRRSASCSCCSWWYSPGTAYFFEECH